MRSQEARAYTSSSRASLALASALPYNRGQWNEGERMDQREAFQLRPIPCCCISVSVPDH